jgi:hypothetical protein
VGVCQWRVQETREVARFADGQACCRVHGTEEEFLTAMSLEDQIVDDGD